MSTPLCLATLNATYHHCAFGLRYLFANLQELRAETRLLEFTIAQKPGDIAEAILAEEPRLVGFGVYIWNTRQTREVVSILKRVRPDLVIVLGGPEVSYETAEQPLCQLADHVIQGEADLLFYDFARAFLREGRLPERHAIAGALPEIRQIASPYPYYDEADIAHRVIYVEASRGCPYQCEFCLSSLDKSVRGFDLDRFLADMDALIARGARRLKFVDRTFNLSVATSSRILRFFLERISLGLFLHFEMVPDRLPEELRDLIRRFPPGALQFEIGIQTWNPEVARRVSRRQDEAKVSRNFRFLREETGVHLHADLIAGLPGETLESFGRGFDRLAALEPHEIQVGILKRLKGTPILRHDREWGMVYQDEPPFPILQTGAMSFAELQEIGRFAKFWDLYANSGNFTRTMALLRGKAAVRARPSLFDEFREFARFLDRRHPQRYGIALLNLVESAWVYLTEHSGCDREKARAALCSDYGQDGKRDLPYYLRETDEVPQPARIPASSVIPARQRRHAHTKHTPPAFPFSPSFPGR